MSDPKELLVKMALSAWETQSSRTSKLIGELSDDQLMSEIAPGRNRGIYLLGHLVAVNDGISVILGLGPRQFPGYEKIFIEQPDRAVAEIPDAKTLRGAWSRTVGVLREQFSKLSADEWFEKHTAVSVADFAKEPHRNRLNVVMNRTSHEAYHQGQLVLLKGKTKD